ncbi:histidine phosphatase family protein [Micromonospora sp. NPDC048830]|uniref:histidine phosphatase family protein n=1 Tax=Micromonospora sp. NPDC048830 TaxID=3364257 RepID=UPI003723DD96
MSARWRHACGRNIAVSPTWRAYSLRRPRRLAALTGRRFVRALASPRRRALRTAQLAGVAGVTTDPDLAEWNYGEYEGRTTAEVHEDRPDWNLWTDGCPGGESPTEVGERLDRVLAQVTPLLARGDVALVGHAHALRVLGARWIGLPPSAGGRLRLDTATVSVLGHEHGRQVILRWNQPAPPAPAAAPGPTARH